MRLDAVTMTAVRKLLILSSDTGEGHNSAAAAVENAAKSAGFATSIRKPVEESTKVNRWLAGFYNTLLTHRPQWMGWYFWMIDRFGESRHRAVCASDAEPFSPALH